MLFGVLADVHGNFDALEQAMRAHPDVAFWLCVGDLASRTGAYPEPSVPLYWIKGNNEDFDQVAAFARGMRVVPNLHYLPNGTSAKVGPLTVAALGGTYGPNWYDLRAADLPHAGHLPPAAAALGKPVRNDKRRHFVREEVDACGRLRGMDVLLTHEAPWPFRELNDDGRPAGLPRGARPVAALLERMRPRLHFCGHHHRFQASVVAGVPSVCVDRVSRSYVLVDATTFAWQKMDLAD